MDIVLGWLVLSGIVSILAARRGRSGSGFLILSILLLPLIGFLVLLASRDLAREARDAEIREQESIRQKQAFEAMTAQPLQGSVADELIKLKRLTE